ncbi:MAG: damage-inducible protein CinA, partial [Bacteroidetes bacterium SW_10_40_5]
MKAQLIIIGNEILNGATQDINASFIARQLNEVGIAINEIRVISDESPIIEQQIKDALDYADLVITTGGLGPTNDDMTKDVLAQIAGKDIVYSEEALNSLASYYGNQATAQQRIREGNADIPEGATVLTNKRGTVPGLVMEINQKYIAASPGIPDEVKYLVEFQLIPFLKSKFNLSPVIHKSVLTVGIREAVLANSISDLEEKLPSRIKMAYLPNLGTVKLR